MQSIRYRIKEAHDRHKIYADAHHIDRSYEAGYKDFLQVKPHKSSIKFGKGVELSPRYVGPFKVVEKEGHVSYRLALPDDSKCMHNVFHVSLL
jgi:hypothetical protein